MSSPVVIVEPGGVTDPVTTFPATTETDVALAEVHAETAVEVAGIEATRDVAIAEAMVEAQGGNEELLQLMRDIREDQLLLHQKLDALGAVTVAAAAIAEEAAETAEEAVEEATEEGSGHAEETDEQQLPEEAASTGTGGGAEGEAGGGEGGGGGEAPRVPERRSRRRWLE